MIEAMDNTEKESELTSEQLREAIDQRIKNLTKDVPQTGYMTFQHFNLSPEAFSAWSDIPDPVQTNKDISVLVADPVDYGGNLDTESFPNHHTYVQFDVTPLGDNPSTAKIYQIILDPGKPGKIEVSISRPGLSVSVAPKPDRFTEVSPQTLEFILNTLKEAKPEGQSEPVGVSE